ncbi:MAG: hypothetical protein L6R35_006797 [Caloplaca aegaea]|nr:MAG: hypothetical protein L6R35_006797 [Caloplaca aegaea]
MSSIDLNRIAPLESPLPPVPEGDVLTDAQWTTFLAIADTFIPAIQVSSSHPRDNLSVQASDYADAVDKIRHSLPADAAQDAVQTYLAEKPSALPGFRKLIQRQFGQYARKDAVKGIRVILSALE